MQQKVYLVDSTLSATDEVDGGEGVFLVEGGVRDEGRNWSTSVNLEREEGDRERGGEIGGERAGGERDCGEIERPLSTCIRSS